MNLYMDIIYKIHHIVQSLHTNAVFPKNKTVKLPELTVMDKIQYLEFIEIHYSLAAYVCDLLSQINLSSQDRYRFL